MTIDIIGTVIQGEGYGRQLGFPTANIDRRYYARRKLKIKLGIYGGYVYVVGAAGSRRKKGGQWPSLQGKIWKAGIVIGPLDSSNLPKIEAHLIGFNGNLYGKRLAISLQKFIRPFRKFRSEEALKKQIKKDIQLIKMTRTTKISAE